MKEALGILLLLSSAFSSCTVYKTYPKFTTTTQLVTLRGTDSKQSATEKLGCNPYDLYIVQKEGYSIFKWYYKRELREISKKKLFLPQYSADGEPRLEKKLSEAFLIFNNRDELYSVLTKSGRGDLLSLILFNNDALVVQKRQLNIWFDSSSKKAVSSTGIQLSYEDVIRIIDEFFEGESALNLDEVYEMIDKFFEQ